MTNELFLLLGIVIPSLIVILALSFRLLFVIARLETKVREVGFELKNLQDKNASLSQK
jgi:hypothetical protein